MLSRKHYRVIASIIKDNSVDVVDETTQDGDTTSYINKDDLINDLCVVFARDNNLFNSALFSSACYDE